MLGSVEGAVCLSLTLFLRLGARCPFCHIAAMSCPRGLTELVNSLCFDGFSYELLGLPFSEVARTCEVDGIPTLSMSVAMDLDLVTHNLSLVFNVLTTLLIG